ncbi:hypothetical protein C1701_02420 [Actinoalloteichus sp. AHMU CJ021]|nr:hypothetical protein C1701_02420 [Actinoalloteichus sp. AHMU CJ021]
MTTAVHPGSSTALAHLPPVGTGMSAVRVRVLGPFEFHHGGTAVTPSAAKLRQLLALLAVRENRLVRNDQIIEELWEQHPPRSVSTTLQTYVYQLRKLIRPHERLDRRGARVLGAGSFDLETTANGYLLRCSPGEVDAGAFERLVRQGNAEHAGGRLDTAGRLFRSALALWRGPVFADLSQGPLLQAEAVGLEELYRNATERRIEIDLQSGRHHEVLGELTGLVAQYPTHEGFQTKLMLALYRAGRRSDALHVYQRAREALSAELGLDPSPAIRRLHAQVLAASPVLDVPSLTLTRRQVGPSEAPRHLPARPAALVGRDSEVASAVAALAVPEQRGAVGPTVVLVTGGPGCGVSAFCSDVGHRVAHGFPDGQLHADLGSGVEGGLTPGAALACFLRALGVPAERVPECLEDRIRLFRGRTADLRLLVVVDGLADSAQLHALMPSGAGCAVLAGARRMLPDAAVRRAVRLGPLAEADARGLLLAGLEDHRVASETEAVGELLALCEGVPKAIVTARTRLAVRPHWTVRHLLRSVRTETRLGLPTAQLGIGESVARGLEPLPAQARHALRLLTLAFDGGFTSAQAAEVLDVGVDGAESLLEEITEHQLVTAEAPSSGADVVRYRFSPLVRAAAVTLAGSGRSADQRGWHLVGGRRITPAS